MMRKIIQLISVIVAISGSLLYADNEEKHRINPTKDENAPFGVYVPKDLDDAFNELDKMLSLSLKQEMKNGEEREMVRHHMGLGRWMRNNWALWKGSRLSQYFNDMGILHPDDMSGIILTSYWRYLNKKPLKVEEQVKYYQQYWDKVKATEQK